MRVPPVMTTKNAAIAPTMHRQRHQPAADQLPGRQREQIEGQRPAEDRIDRRRAAARTAGEPAASTARASFQSLIIAAPVAAAMTQRAAERGDPDHRFDRQLDRLAVDQDRQTGELAERAPA